MNSSRVEFMRARDPGAPWPGRGYLLPAGRRDQLRALLGQIAELTGQEDLWDPAVVVDYAAAHDVLATGWEMLLGTASAPAGEPGRPAGRHAHPEGLRRPDPRRAPAPARDRTGPGAGGARRATPDRRHRGVGQRGRRCRLQPRLRPGHRVPDRPRPLVARDRLRRPGCAVGRGDPRRRPGEPGRARRHRAGGGDGPPRHRAPGLGRPAGRAASTGRLPSPRCPGPMSPRRSWPTAAWWGSCTPTATTRSATSTRPTARCWRRSGRAWATRWPVARCWTG